jgi:hypothetical protein
MDKSNKIASNDLAAVGPEPEQPLPVPDTIVRVEGWGRAHGTSWSGEPA